MTQSLRTGALVLTALVVATSSQAEVDVVVTDIDTGDAIVAVTVLMERGSVSVPLGETDNKGVVQYSATTCQFGDLIQVQPQQGEGYSPLAQPKACAKNPIPVKLRSDGVRRHIEVVARTSEAKGRYALAAQAYNEAYATTETQSAQLSVYKNTAMALHVKGPATVFDPVQSQQVASPELVVKVKAFQSAHSITPTGRIDAATLRSLASGSVQRNKLDAK